MLHLHVQEFLDDGNGHVSGIRTVLVNWTKNETGRWVMNEVPDSEKVYKADMVSDKLRISPLSGYFIHLDVRYGSHGPLLLQPSRLDYT